MDRSGAYVLRQDADSIVTIGLARRCIVQISYAIGVLEHLSILFTFFGNPVDCEEEFSFQALYDFYHS